MSGDDSRTARRKAEHLRINLDEDVRSRLDPGFGGWQFLPRALPELDLDAVNTGTELFGRRLRAPILISCMTGGTAEAGRINRALAEVAQTSRLALGLGSGRALLEDPSQLDSFDVRELAPDVPLLANLGAVQLNRGITPGDCDRLVTMLRADALALHLNALQEALQPGGDVAFGGILAQIEKLSASCAVPVVVKEVGWGIPPDDVRRLLDCGVYAVDLAGAGGTSWSEVEKHRSDATQGRIAAAFRDWGIPTAEAVRRARAAAPGGRLIASGGVRDGLDAAKAIALGADLVGIAGPFLRAAAAGTPRAAQLAAEVTAVLRIAMFCTGCADLSQLRGTPRLEAVRAPISG